jgi:hypothetical protein
MLRQEDHKFEAKLSYTSEIPPSPPKSSNIFLKNIFHLCGSYYDIEYEKVLFLLSFSLFQWLSTYLRHVFYRDVW